MAYGVIFKDVLENVIINADQVIIDEGIIKFYDSHKEKRTHNDLLTPVALIPCSVINYIKSL